MTFIRGGFVYIMTNKYNKVLYTGVTSDLNTRVRLHRIKYYPSSFTAKYNCNKLVYFNGFSRIEEAINEEKRIKGGSRQDKLELIKSMNPNWIDLFDQIKDW